MRSATKSLTDSDLTSRQVIYEVWEELEKEEATVLPGVPLESPKQFFLVVMAFHRCSALPPVYFQRLFKEPRSHLINALRLNGDLTHFSAFTEGNKLYRHHSVFSATPEKWTTRRTKSSDARHYFKSTKKKSQAFGRIIHPRAGSKNASLRTGGEERIMRIFD